MQNLSVIIMIGIFCVIVFGPVFAIRFYKRKKYLEKVRNMSEVEKNREILKLSSQISEYKTSHAFHAIMSLLFFGLWIIPWFLIAQSNASHRNEIKKMMDSI